jgi:hypothetical protein
VYTEYFYAFFPKKRKERICLKNIMEFLLRSTRNKKQNVLIPILLVLAITLLLPCCSKYSEEDYQRAVKNKDYALLAEIAMIDDKIGMHARHKFDEDLTNLIIEEKKAGVKKISSILTIIYPVLKKALYSKNISENGPALKALHYITPLAGLRKYESEIYKAFRESKLISLSDIILKHSNELPPGNDMSSRPTALFLLHIYTLYFGKDIIPRHNIDLFNTFIKAAKSDYLYERSLGYNFFIMVGDVYATKLDSSYHKKIQNTRTAGKKGMTKELEIYLYSHFDDIVKRFK